MKLLNQKKCINPHFMKSGLGGCEDFAWGEKLPRRWRVRPKVSGGGAPRSPAKVRQALRRMTISSQGSWFRWSAVSEGEDRLLGRKQ